METYIYTITIKVLRCSKLKSRKFCWGRKIKSTEGKYTLPGRWEVGSVNNWGKSLKDNLWMEFKEKKTESPRLQVKNVQGRVEERSKTLAQWEIKIIATVGDQTEQCTMDYFKNFDIYCKWRTSERKKDIFPITVGNINSDI